MRPTPGDEAFVDELIDLTLALAAELQALAPPDAPASPALTQVLDRVIPILEAQTQAERRAAASYRSLVTLQ
jgi:hypothetical protein